MQVVHTFQKPQVSLTTIVAMKRDLLQAIQVLMAAEFLVVGRLYDDHRVLVHVQFDHNIFALQEDLPS